ncbi:MAG: hypothetical protein M1820_008976 [Bogoriella megaspora]|nr:MAG: hypothetical protein M1820_008976 [Bogoriella megaspora]
MDPFQVAASGLAVVELGFKLYDALSTFVTKARQADEEARELRETVRRSLKTLITVNETLKARLKELGQGRVTPEEQNIWININESLISWDRNLKKLKRKVQDVPRRGSAQGHMNWIDKALLQLKLDRRSPVILQFQRNIKEHMQELSLSLQCLNIFMQQERDKLIDELISGLHQITSDQDTHDITFVSTATSSSNLRRRRSQHQKTMHNCIHTAYAVAEKFSTCGDSDINFAIRTPGGLRGDDTEWSTETETDVPDEDSELARSPVIERPPSNRLQTQKASGSTPSVKQIEDVVGDSDLDFDSSTPREILGALIDNYRRHAYQECQAGKYELAEEHQRRMIEHAEEWNAIYDPCRDVVDMKRDLVTILKNQGTPGKLTESTSILQSVILSSKKQESQTSPRLPVSRSSSPTSPLDVRTALQRSEDYLALAEILYTQFQSERRPKALRQSHLYAKESFKLCLPFKHLPHSNFPRYVEFLVQIIMQFNRPVEAETYRTLFLQPHSMPVTPPPQASQSPVSPHSSQSQFSYSPHPLQSQFSYSSQQSQFQEHTTLPIPTAPTAPARRQPSRTMVDPNGLDPLTQRPYLIEAILGNSLENVDLLLQCSANANLIFEGKTTLMWAVDAGSPESVIKLRNWGAEINTSEPVRTGRTVLHYAIDMREAKMVDTLLEHGADIEKRYRPKAPQEQQGDPNAGLTPLLRAAQHKFPEVIHILLRRNASVNARDSDGFTALHYTLRGEASAGSGMQCAEILFSSGADPNLGCIEEKRTPLHESVIYSNEVSARCLLNHLPAVELEAEDRIGRTAATLAARYGKYELLKMLLLEGARIPRLKGGREGWPRNIEMLMKSVEKERRERERALVGRVETGDLVGRTGSIDTESMSGSSIGEEKRRGRMGSLVDRVRMRRFTNQTT